MRTVGFILLVLACLSICAQTSDATIRRVPSQYATIQAGINAAVHGDTVLVSDGGYVENIRFRGKRLVVASLYLMDGDTSHIRNTIIDGSNPSHPDSGSVVYFINGEDTTSVLCGFTIGGGTGTPFTYPGLTARGGGGILLGRSGARICHNFITQSQITGSGQGAWGGGIEALLDSLDYIIVESNQITDNLDSCAGSLSAASGGGIDINGLDPGGAHGRIVGNTVSANRAVSLSANMNAWAGGISLYRASMLVSNNVITGNSTGAPNCSMYPSWGGGLMAYDVALDLVNNRVTDNVVEALGGGRGGGICVATESTAGLRDVLVSGNYVASNSALGGQSGGGGVLILDQRPRVENNAIVGNISIYGGGVALLRYSTGDAFPGAESPRLKGKAREEHSLAGELTLPAPVLINNTIAYNKASSGHGGAIYSTGTWSPVVVNSIAWGDTCMEEIYLTGDADINVQYCDVQGGWSGTGNIDVDPRFVDSALALSDNSLCIGAGRDSVQVGGMWYHAPSSCLHGGPRPNPAGSNPDIGACENPLALPTGIEEIRDGLPAAFALEQNYPNPFNPSTTIRYDVPHASFVMLTVYNTLGQQVAQLVNEQQQPGYHHVVFRADDLASGVYFYRLEASRCTSVKKLILLR